MSCCGEDLFLILLTGVIGKPNGNGPVYNVVASSNAEDEEVFDLDD